MAGAFSGGAGAVFGGRWRRFRGAFERGVWGMITMDAGNSYRKTSEIKKRGRKGKKMR